MLSLGSAQSWSRNVSPSLRRSLRVPLRLCPRTRKAATPPPLRPFSLPVSSSWFLASASSNLSHPAIHVDLHSRDVRGVRRSQKRHCARDFLGLPESLHRYL